MTEANLRKTFVRLMNDVGQHPQSIEVLYKGSVPDQNIVEGWVELKVRKAWPKRSTTGVRLADMPRVARQCSWLYTRWQRGGGAWLLLVVGSEWVLLTGEQAYRAWALPVLTGGSLKCLVRANLVARAAGHWYGRPSGVDLVRAMRKSRGQ